MNMDDTRGYVLNGTTVLPLQPTSPTPRGPRDPRRVRRRIRLRFLGFLLVPLLLGGAILLGVLFFAPPTRDVEVLPGSAILRIGEDDVAVVVYADTTRPGPLEPMFQTRAAAIRLSDGEVRWDQRLNEELASEAVALAGDASRVYVGTDEGLVILDAVTGAVQAQGGGIAGLGADAVLSASAYGYDREANAVVALSATGGFVQIPVGALEAQPADAEVASRWQGMLSAAAFLDTAELTRLVDAAATAEGTVLVVEQVAESVGRDALVITSADGSLVRRTELVDAEILPVSGLEPRLGVMLETGQFLEGDFRGIDPADLEALLEAASTLTDQAIPVPAGADSGFVLVQHRESVNAERTLLSSIEIATGRIVDTVEMGADAVRAMTGPAGATAVIAADPEAWFPNTLVVLDDGGALRQIDVGALPWWQAPFG